MTLYKRQHHITSYYHYFLTKVTTKNHCFEVEDLDATPVLGGGPKESHRDQGMNISVFTESWMILDNYMLWFLRLLKWCFNVMLWQTQSPCDYECLWLNTLVFVDVILISHNLFWAEENKKNLARATRSQFFKFLGFHCFSLLHKKSRFQGLSNFHKGSNVVQARYLLTSRPISTGWTMLSQQAIKEWYLVSRGWQMSVVKLLFFNSVKPKRLRRSALYSFPSVASCLWAAAEPLNWPLQSAIFVGSNSSQEAWSKVAALKAPLRLCTMFWVFSISVLVLASGDALRGEAVPDAVLNLSCDHCELRERLANLKLGVPRVRSSRATNATNAANATNATNTTKLDCSELCTYAGADSGACKSGSSCVCTIATYQKCRTCSGFRVKFCTLSCSAGGSGPGTCARGSSCCCTWPAQSASVDVSPYGCWMQWPGDCKAKAEPLINYAFFDLAGPCRRYTRPT